jgi:5-(carboxyamino)imidazole ribonucleotide mutase
MPKNFIAILMGSDSDLPVMQGAIEVLSSFSLPFEVKITSAHRTPEVTRQYIADAEKRGCAVFIAAAGMAAHLAGTVAAHTVKPVIGVPMDAGLNGLDALLSTAQMPAGIPVACVTIGSAGAKNAAYLAAQMLALQDEKLAAQLLHDREAKAKAMQIKDAAIQQKYARNGNE